AERGEGGCVLAADDPAADDRQARRDAVHAEDGVGIEHHRLVERDIRWAVRERAGGDEDDVSPEVRDTALRARDAERVRVLEAGGPPDDADPVAGEGALDPAPLLGDHDVLAAPAGAHRPTPPAR